jgi:hypothetical protein
LLHPFNLIQEEDQTYGQLKREITLWEYAMEMTWENLTKLFTWAAQRGSDPPLADTAGESIVIDGAVTKEDFERFLESQSESPEG